jgi:hypothetical protein
MGGHRCGALSRAGPCKSTLLDNGNPCLRSAAGFVLGILGSYLTWLVIGVRYVPRFEISQIAKTLEPRLAVGVSYRIKLLNQRHRPINDLSLVCRLYIRGLNTDPYRVPNRTSFHIPVGDQFTFPFLDARESRIYTLRVTQLSGGRVVRLPEEVRRRIVAETVSLEELLALGNGAYLRLAVAGADG